MAYKLVLIRHGNSMWNKLDRFTGWADVDLSEQGEGEARKAGALLKENGFVFDRGYTSVLKRAIRTYQLAMESADMTWLPVTKSWRLNERHYGGLQGKNKNDAMDDYGADTVKDWRRAYDTKPPLLSEFDPRHPSREERYRGISPEELPIGESLKDTLDRVLPYWENELKPAIYSGQRLIIAAHGNSLRALVKNLENLTKEQVLDLEIPTGKPLVYELNESDLRVEKKYYLKSKEEQKNSWFGFFKKQ